jgi:hypothetical protein
MNRSDHWQNLAWLGELLHYARFDSNAEGSVPLPLLKKYKYSSPTFPFWNKLRWELVQNEQGTRSGPVVIGWKVVPDPYSGP